MWRLKLKRGVKFLACGLDGLKLVVVGAARVDLDGAMIGNGLCLGLRSMEGRFG